MTVNTDCGKITASKDTLNSLVSMIYDAAEHRSRLEYDALSNHATKIWNQIFDTLHDAGYYDEIEKARYEKCGTITHVGEQTNRKCNEYDDARR